MGKIQPVESVKAVFGVLYREFSLFEQACRWIQTELGPMDLLSEKYPFIETDYYAPEMGADLIRQYFSLENLIPPERLVSLKIISNQWEEQLSLEGKRRINLDPGYLSSSTLILASTKNFSHRLYLGQGIYGEVTMRFMHGTFTELPWTYPDYSHHKAFFLEVRKKYREQLKRINAVAE